MGKNTHGRNFQRNIPPVSLEVRKNYKYIPMEYFIHLRDFTLKYTWGTETIRVLNSHKVEKSYAAFKRVFYYLLLSQ